MPIHLAHHLRSAAAWTAIAVAGGVAGLLSYRTRDAQQRKDLIQQAELAALACEEAELTRIGGSPADVATAEDTALKQRLHKLQLVNPRVGLVSVLRVDPATGQATVLADSAGPEAKAESIAGNKLRQPSPAATLQKTISSGKPISDGPRTDDLGTWVTAYVPIGAAQSGPPAKRHILRLDIAAADWQQNLRWEAFQRAVMIWVLLGLPLGAWLVVRRQREQNEVIRNLFEAMEQSLSAVVITDREGRIEYVNRSLCGLLGYGRRELIGHHWRSFHPSGEAARQFAEIDASLRAGTPWEGEWLGQRKEGTTFPVRGGLAPVKHRDGRIASFVAVFEDVSEAKRREVELREASELAQSADRAKSQFLATMSHEVRTPLNGIVGFTSLLLETPLTAEQSEYVQTIRMSTEALIQLTDDILDFARIEAGRVKLDPVPCDPRACVEEALDLLAARAAEKGLELLHRCEPGVPAAILIDSGRLRQVLVNLIGNAVKFTEHGEVEVTVGVLPEPAGQTPPPPSDNSPACLLSFAVRDTGIGISAENQAKLFRAFSQIEGSTTRRFGGTGLGLAISRNLVGLMGGTVEVRSAEGAGSVFTFTIRAPVITPPVPPHDLRGLHLALVVAPGPLRRELADLLRAWQATVTEVSHIDALASTRADCTLIDLAAGLTRHLADQAETPSGWPAERAIGLLPISTSNELRNQLRRHFRALVNKPVHHEALFTLLSGAQQQTEAPAVSGEQFGFRVLVAEDNAINWRLAQRVLENMGCVATRAENGREALEILQRRPRDFDLLVLDMHMPVMDGMETLRAIRAGQAGPEVQAIWVIALTADVREPQRMEALTAGLNAFLTKPLNVGRFEAALRQVRQARCVRGEGALPGQSATGEILSR